MIKTKQNKQRKTFVAINNSHLTSAQDLDLPAGKGNVLLYLYVPWPQHTDWTRLATH